jgi:hypothetical protein
MLKVVTSSRVVSEVDDSGFNGAFGMMVIDDIRHGFLEYPHPVFTVLRIGATTNGLSGLKILWRELPEISRALSICLQRARGCVDQ